jgi:hypothetical protein
MPCQRIRTDLSQAAPRHAQREPSDDLVDVGPQLHKLYFI